MLGQILRAQKVNRVLGGAAVMPWEVDDLPDEWLDAFDGLTDGMERMREHQAKVEEAKRRARKR